MISLPERLKMLCSIEGISLTELERIIGTSKGVFTRAVSNNTDVQSKWLSAIADKYPDWSIEWLITGKGSSLKSEHGNDDIYKAAYDAVKAEEMNADNYRFRLPMKVTAGMLSVIAESATSENCEQVPVIKALPDYDFTMIITGDSMEPKFEGGDEIAIKKVDKVIEWGKPYVLDTRDGAVLKRIYDAGDQLRCVSYNKDYPDFLIDKIDILGVYRVVGQLRY